jgi:large subunit ribosomal protein L21
MYAVIQTGGKQYKVAPGHTLKIDKIPAEVGTNVDFNKVLMVGNGEDIRIGTPLVDNGKVTATILEQGRGKKIKIIKFKRRKHHLKRMGHRQHYTQVRITGIMADGIEATWTKPEPKTVETTAPETETVETAPVVETPTSSAATSNDGAQTATPVA